jgi:hypothetical protein
MKQIIFSIIIVALSGSSFGMTETFLRMKPDREYMNFALKHYLKFHDSTFPSSIVQTPFIKKLIKHIDHWLVPGHPELDQLQFGHSLDQESKITLSQRIYIHPELRRDPYILRLKLKEGFEPWFYFVNESGTSCFIGPMENEKEFQLHHLCREKDDSTFTPRAREVISRERRANWSNPFPALNDWEIRTLVGEKVKSIFYFSRSTHPSRVPKELITVINLHGIHALFPFYKYSIDDEGRMTVYYP